MSATLDTSVLEEAARDAEFTEVDEGDDFSEEQLLQDLSEGETLLRKAKTLLDYIGDPELCKVLSKKERATILKVSKKIGTYVGSIAQSYGEIKDVVSV